MSSSPVENGIFPLSIAGLCVLLASDHTGLTEQIRRRYQLFSDVGKNPHRLNLRIISDYTGSSEEQINITARGLTVIHQTYEGCINFEQNTSEILLNGEHPLADVEYFLRLVYSFTGFKAGGFLVHAAGVVRKGSSYLFIGPSGSGKSTVANFSAQYRVLNDDLVMVLPDQGNWNVFSTPFWNQGRGVKARPSSAPLAGMFRLVKDKVNYLEPLTTGETLAELIACIPVLSRSPSFSIDLFERCLALIQQIPVYRLHFLPDSSFWEVIC